MKKKLRYYQQESCQAIAKAWRNPGAVPYISVMTGLGKSLICAALANWRINEGDNVLILVPRLELVKQNYKELIEYTDDASKIGIVCNQLGKLQFSRLCVVAMYQSYVKYKSADIKVDTLIIDEAHDIGNELDSTYRKIIRSLKYKNPAIKICGMTATPYRLGQGMLHQDCLKGEALFTDCVYDTSIYPGLKKLIEDKYLAQIEILNNHFNVDLSGVAKSGQDYNQAQAGVKFDAIINDAVNDMRQHYLEHDIKTSLIFASSIANAVRILEQWGDSSTMRILSSKISRTERESVIHWLKNGSGERHIVNVNILTTGFDFPALEHITLLRATVSPGLLVQMAGRLLRPYGEKVGTILDYGTNIERLGFLDEVKVPKNRKEIKEASKKPCLECGTLNNLSAKKCSQCEALFISEDETGNYSMRTKADALAMKKQGKIKTHDITETYYEMAFSRKDNTPMVKMRMFYVTKQIHEHYLCLEHDGNIKNLARTQALALFKNPKDFYAIVGGNDLTCENMLYLLENNREYFKEVIRITLKSSDESKYKTLVSWELE